MNCNKIYPQNSSQISSRKQVLLIISAICLLFTILISILLILNYIQLKTNTNQDHEIIEKLIVKLNESPENDELKQQIRTIDLLSRKAYFTKQWQNDLGAIILWISFTGFIVTIILYQKLNPKKINPANEEKQNYWEIKSRERNTLILGVTFITILGISLNIIARKDYAGISMNSVLSQKDNKQDSIQIIAIKKSDLEALDSFEKSSPKSDTNIFPTKDTSNINHILDTVKTIDYPTDNQILSNYPSFRGPFGLGVSYHKNIPTEWDASTGKNIIWKASVVLPGLNSPIIWGNYLFISGSNGSNQAIYAYNRNSGKLIWSKDIEKIEGSPTTPPKVNAETGWAASTLTTDGKRIFAIFATGDLICLDYKGNILWSKNVGVPVNHYGHSSSLLVYKDLLYVQYDQSRTRNLFAYDILTGQIRWNTNRPGNISWSSPILVKWNNSMQIILNNDPYTAGYDTETGKELWKYETLYGEIGASPAFSDGIVFAANIYAKLCALKLGNQPVQLWENNDYLPDVSSPVAWKGLLFICTSAGEAACYDIQSGNLNWMHEFDFGFYASPVIADNKVFFTDRNGNTHVVKAEKEFSLIATNKLAEKSDCTPAFANQRIYIRSKNHLFCIGIK